MAESDFAAAAIVFVLGALGAESLYRAWFLAPRLRGDRLIEPIYLSSARDSAAQDPPDQNGITRHLSKLLAPPGRDHRGGPAQRQLAQMLSYAGHRGGRALMNFQLMRIASVVILALLGAAAGWELGSLTLEFAAGFGMAGYVVPKSMLASRGRKRQGQLARELPALIDLLVVCLEAGLAIPEAIRMAAHEYERRGSLLGAELAKATAEMSTGVNLGDSLTSLGDHSGSDELKALAALLIQSERMGTRLGPALRASAEQLATRRRMRAEEKAQKSAVKMLLPLVVLILPAMLILVLGPAFIQIVDTLTK
jgi:tight adherence protein C